MLLVCIGNVANAQAPLRRHDDRPVIDLNKASAEGINRYASKRLILLTDIEADKAQRLVTLVDQVYPGWEQQLGPVPTARDKSSFQITGYLMRDEEKFERAGLVRKNLKVIHGQHSGYEFWMKDAEYDYYREHLLLHEASHCLMQSLDDGLKPVWYLEGMAEFFGSHETVAQQLSFGVLPVSRQSAMGFGRIEMIRTECAEGRALSAAEVTQLGAKEFSDSRTTPYAWSWAFCTFLSRHPQFAAEFRRVCQTWETEPFSADFETFWAKHQRDIAAEWEVFRDSLCYGWDLDRGASVTAAPPAGPLQVRADRGWQNMGVKVQAGRSIEITAKGRVVLAKTTKPWESEPQGISLRYSEGRPIGRLLGAILRDEPERRGAGYWEFFEVGQTAMVELKSNGTLYLRVNDRWNELSDNSGSYEVQASVK